MRPPPDSAALREALATYERVETTPLEQHLFEEVGPRIRAAGHAVKEALADVVRWRAQRASGFVARNDPAEVVEITHLAFGEDVSDRVRLKLLTLLDGMAERTASVLLAMWDPQRYVPWDERTAGVLVEAGLLTESALPGAWPGFLGAVASLAQESGLSSRDVEKALFVLGGGGTPPAVPAGADGSGHGQKASRGTVMAPEDVGDPYDEAGSALLAELDANQEGVRDFAVTKERAHATLRVTTPAQRRLLLRLHRELSRQMLTKASRDLGWLYYASDVGKGLVGEVALRIPRGVHEVRLVVYLPVDVSAGRNREWFEPSSATQKKAQIPPDAVDFDDLVRVFEEARRWVLLR